MTTIDLDTVCRAAWDAVVIGAGPAGAVAAREIARRGGRVLLVDKKPFPRQKVCGACVNGHALAVLRGLGLERMVSQLGAVPLQQFHLWCDARELTVPLPAGVAVSRERFDAALVREAVAAGAKLLPQTTATVGDARERDRTVSLRSEREFGRPVFAISASVVLVADGLARSSLAGQRGFEGCVSPRSRIGAGCVVSRASGGLVRGTIIMAIGRHGYVGMVRLEDGSLNVAAAIDPAAIRAAGGLGVAAERLVSQAGFSESPPLASEDWRGTPALTQRPSRVAARRLFLLGDAAGYVEPFTGEGIAWALESAASLAPLAARAATEWDDALAAEWSATHARLVRRRQWLCRALAFALRHPALVRLATRFAEFVPSAAARIAARLNTPTVPSLRRVTLSHGRLP